MADFKDVYALAKVQATNDGGFFVYVDRLFQLATNAMGPEPRCTPNANLELV